MRPLQFFNLDILSSATTALKTLFQGRLYPHIHLYIYIYIYIYIYKYYEREKGTQLHFRQACFVNRFTLQGFNERIFM